MSISRWPIKAALGLFFAGAGFGQTPMFEAASVKVVDLASRPVFGNSGGPGTSDAGRIHLCCVGMFALLMRAYDVDLDQIAGPSWIMDNMGPVLYQIDATMAPGTTKPQYRLMMQNLLAERFHLAIHREARNFPAYAMVIANGGPKLKESKGDDGAVAPENPPMPPKRAADGTFALPPGPQMLTALGRGMVHVQAQEKTLGDLVKGMGRLIADSQGADPGDFTSPKARVMDRTGLTGKYDFTLEFACEGCRGSSAPDEGAGLPSIFGALEKQLGLKLEKRHDVQLDVIVVDRVDKTPTEN
ncbi:MAG TPA: TIGR03435 family protein [Bryobacteraceae bacterium]|nr:TIGR03435 family protein [Bryobacteraceae bacterium]